MGQIPHFQKPMAKQTTVPPASGRPPPRRPPWPAPPGARAVPSAAPGAPAPGPARGTAALGLRPRGHGDHGDAWPRGAVKEGGGLCGEYMENG